MKKSILYIMMFSLMFNLLYCSGGRYLSLKESEVGESLKFILTDGEMVEGVLLKKESNSIKYVDTKTNKPEDLVNSRIQRLEYSRLVYDLEAKPIPENEIGRMKGGTKTFAYGIGGLVLGAAVGFGVGALMLESTEIPLIYPMGVLGLVGGIYFGYKGSGSDREDAITQIRRERYKITEAKLKVKLAEEKKKLELQQQEKEKMLEQIKKKKQIEPEQ